MMNKAMLIGRLGKDPDVRAAQTGTVFTTFTVATSTRWTSPDGQKQVRTEWHNIIAWGKLAEFCGEFLKKGRLVYLEGRLQTRQWEQDGTRRQASEIVAQELHVLDRLPHGEDAPPPPAPSDLSDTPF